MFLRREERKELRKVDFEKLVGKEKNYMENNKTEEFLFSMIKRAPDVMEDSQNYIAEHKDSKKDERNIRTQMEQEWELSGFWY